MKRKTEYPLHKFKAGRYAYRGFNIRKSARLWEILDADSEPTEVKSLRAAIRLIGAWYAHGIVA